MGAYMFLVIERLELITLEKNYYIMGILSSIFLIAGTVLALFQYFHQKKLSRIREASNIAKYFEEDIVDAISLILVSFSLKTNVKDFIANKKDKIETAKYFSKEELVELFEQKEIEAYSKFLREPMVEGEFITLSEFLCKTLNKLEHCAISFNSKLAEDKAVYQCLHQLLFKLMPFAYIFICTRNVNNVDKYYTNVCSLYKRWIKIQSKAIKKERKAEVKYQKQKDARARAGMIKLPTAR